MSADNPYVGPRPFTAEQRLFGRKRERSELVDLVVAERIVVLHSPSGAGKTSLLQAQGGVLDKLRDEGFSILPLARVGLPPPNPPPQNRYLDSLLGSLEHESAAGTPLVETIGAMMARNAEALGLVLTIDQFEEILTVDPTGEAERVAFFRALGRALENRQLWAILALREEYLGALAPYRPMLPTHLRTMYRLDLLGPEAAREAIVSPARDVGVPFTATAAEKLVQELCTITVPRPDGTAGRKLGPCVEPVELQVVCHRLWLRRDLAAKEISEDDIDAVESVDAALYDYYAAAITGAAGAEGASERRIRDWIERELITKAGVRSQVMRYGERGEGVPDQAVQHMIDAYILRQDTRRGVDWLELAHDRLVKPIGKNNAAWRREHLNVAQVQAALWVDRGRADALCLRGEALAEAERWAARHQGELLPIEEQFLAASRKLWATELAEKARHRWEMSIAVAMAVIMGALGLWAWNKKLEVDTERKSSKESSLMANARVLLAQGQPAWAMKVLLEVQAPEKRRGWIDLANEVLNSGGLVMTIRARLGAALAVAWSPDSKSIVATPDAHLMQIWSADGRGAPLSLARSEAKISAAAWSPDGRRIVGLFHNAKPVGVWSIDDPGKLIILRGHTEKVVSAAWSPDSKKIVTASKDWTARVWNADGSGEPIVLRGHEQPVVAAAWSPDGARIVTASWDGTARVWNADGSGKVVVLRGHMEQVVSAAWSPDGTRIVTAGQDKTARVWNADGSGKHITLRGHEFRLYSAAWSPDSKRIVTASKDWTARVWNADGSGEPFILRGHEAEVTSAAFSPQGDRLVTAADDKTARVWRAESLGEPVVLRGHEAEISAVAWSPDGQRLVTTSADKTARVWNAGGSGELLSERHGRLGHSSAFSPDLERIAWGWLTTVNVQSTSGTGPLLVFRGHEGRVRSAAWSPDGQKLVSASEDHTARVWNADGSGEPVVLRGHSATVLSAIFSPNSKRVVTASADGTARVWNADGSGEPIVLRGHEDRVISAAWSPDGRRIITGSDDVTARIWNADGSGEPVVLRGHGDSVQAVAWDPDGKRIVTGSYDNTVRVWGVDSPAKSIVLYGHEAPVLCAEFSADGKTIVTGSNDMTARVWNADGSGEAIVLRGHPGYVHVASFVPGSEQVLTADYEGSVQVWDLSVPLLKRDLAEANADCLPSSARHNYLEENKVQAKERCEACEREHARKPMDLETP